MKIKVIQTFRLNVCNPLFLSLEMLATHKEHSIFDVFCFTQGYILPVH